MLLALTLLGGIPSAHAFVTPCAFPGGMYAGNNECKYAQARNDTRCIESRTTSTGTDCYELQFLRFNYRGGTADYRSPRTTGSCRYAGTTGVGQWQLSYFGVRNGGTTLYSASTAHYVLRNNCDVEAGPFYGSPVPFSFRSTSYAHYTFVHHCPTGSSCSSFVSDIDFMMIVG
jgi:hypothetical protein